MDNESIVSHCYRLYNYVSDIYFRLRNKVAYSDAMMELMDELTPGISDHMDKVLSHYDEERSKHLKGVMFFELIAFMYATTLMYKERFFDQNIFEEDSNHRVRSIEFSRHFKARMESLKEKYKIDAEEFIDIIKCMDKIIIKVVI